MLHRNQDEAEMAKTSSKSETRKIAQILSDFGFLAITRSKMVRLS